MPERWPSAARNSQGEGRRAKHLSICHRTGSGRYIVISPSVTGATNGHLKHHDDFVYTGSCVAPAPSPPEEPGPPEEPPPVRPPREPTSPEGGPPAPTPRGELPFTGLPALYLLVAGCLLVATGAALRRRARP